MNYRFILTKTGFTFIRVFIIWLTTIINEILAAIVTMKVVIVLFVFFNLLQSINHKYK